MDINLPLILMLAVAVTGAITLYDFIFLRPQRKQALAGVEEQFGSLDDEQHEGNPAYVAAVERARTEPAFVEYGKSFFPILAIVFVLRSFIIEPFQIPSESMLPNLHVGDFIAVSKSSYGIRLPVFRNKVMDITDPKRGDVMVFFPPHKDQYYIKRVIGLPGDVVEINNHQLKINGKEVPQTFVRAETPKDSDGVCRRGFAKYEIATETLGDKTYEIRKCSRPGNLSVKGKFYVKEGHYLMIGDNRDNSSDGRDWGQVPEQRIVGKAFAIWMHWNERFSLPSFSRAGKIE